MSSVCSFTVDGRSYFRYCWHHCTRIRRGQHTIKIQYEGGVDRQPHKILWHRTLRRQHFSGITQKCRRVTLSTKTMQLRGTTTVSGRRRNRIAQQHMWCWYVYNALSVGMPKWIVWRRTRSWWGSWRTVNECTKSWTVSCPLSLSSCRTDVRVMCVKSSGLTKVMSCVPCVPKA